MKFLKLWVAIISLLGLSRISLSFPKQPDSHYKACLSKKRGDTCSLKINDKTVSGVCKKDYDSKVFCHAKPKKPETKKEK